LNVTLTTNADQFERAREQLARTAAGPLAARRETGWEQFRATGLPTRRDEEWRFTSTAPIAKGDFALARSGEVPSEDLIRPFSFGGVSSAKLVFVNGHFCPQHSRRLTLPDKVLAGNLADAAVSHPQLVSEHLDRHPRSADDPFTALNLAFLEDGAFIHVPAGLRVEGPIHLLYASTNGSEPLMCHPRNLVVLDEGSEVMVVEHYVSLHEGPAFSNVVTEAVVGPGARLNHYVLERENEQAINIETLAVRQERDSCLDSHTALFGGRLVRNNIHVTLAGEGCDSLINGLYVGHGEQHLDNHMRVVHAAPNCHSRQLYKGILDEQSHGIFSGRIVVEEGAQKTDAVQTNRNLLLSDSAKANAKPQLEIYADDVKCTHGATTGQLDPDALFYLRQRGIDETTARGLLIYAFASENIQSMSVPSIRRQLLQALVQKLPHTAMFDATGEEAQVVEEALGAAT